ncbi:MULTISPECIES: glucans biosynthesis glucosyltransferase MdoH [Thalassospira]|jgi:membrane glycosyltransferase|uniref:Glucans biosynthesis glucosyltransferase H n=2 Tax=Thalassospiraceae TaxID=2844866 RepID=A0ABR5Y617_9PROT|nr:MULTISPECIES: glucans biosynthesis glucosyltransferase MdoH [Thalassospira]KZD06672.1 glucosyl transferase [Thalassospira xiamenensis]OHY99810.1 glucan biosynthesis glucosyltransferase H [Thalassospira sp. MIT1004]QPL35453.1 glucans biosynthesis glucosyltransferase MdoH [Thalassospira sp. B30-1]KZD10727.1 glucosyl transferase [Thalassospira xiamenensis]MAB32473.1 glucans biosynthesis glucosyltransferase MdoH [Thalassospira sp.]|tara:strand:- start:708 stop:2822 length:2115 start_codon:yes stop_codon:yes gene_type:complete
MSRISDPMPDSAANHGVNEDDLDPTVKLRGPGVGSRRIFLFGASIFATAYAAWLMADVLGADQLTVMEMVVIAFFTINFAWISVSFFTGIVGIFLRGFGLDAITLKRLKPIARKGSLRSRNVVVIPVYNEDPDRVFAGLRASYESLVATGEIDAFDFFVLSDTRDPDIWIAEEVAWAKACADLKARGKIFFRRRAENTERKSGNLKEFCETYATHYDHMIVFDADSVMSGEAMVNMAYLMENNPDAGIIQSPPQPTGRQTLFARILQFISRVHGPTMSAGLSFWCMGSSNYWGHNAIIRVQAFIDCCGLPVLSGKPPMGGHILSHDFVEAAFMRKAGWRCWLIPQLEGSWEELPPNLIDYAIRDRRWCQGNMQHARLLFAPGFRPLSRLHFFMGVMSFGSSPLWLLLLLSSTIATLQNTQLTYSFFPSQFTMFPQWPVDRSFEMLVLLVFTIGMLVVPKIISILMVCLGRDRKKYGGVMVLASGVLETLYSALQAPIMMMLHAQFVFSVLTGNQVGWDAQERDDTGVPFKAALKTHRTIIVIGLIWGAVALFVDTAFFWWLSPILAGLVLAPWLTHWSSSLAIGRAARRMKLFVTPEETESPEELATLARLTAEAPDEDVKDGLLRLIEDPFANALHSALLPARKPDRRTQIEIGIIYEKLSRLGVESLTKDEKLKILSWPVKPLDQIMAGKKDENAKMPANSS